MVVVSGILMNLFEAKLKVKCKFYHKKLSLDVHDFILYPIEFVVNVVVVLKA